MSRLFIFWAAYNLPLHDGLPECCGSMYTMIHVIVYFSVMMYGGLARETGHVHRPHLSNRNITPEELDGLEAVLKLTERVADQVGS